MTVMMYMHYKDVQELYIGVSGVADANTKFAKFYARRQCVLRRQFLDVSCWCYTEKFDGSTLFVLRRDYDCGNNSGYNVRMRQYKRQYDSASG